MLLHFGCIKNRSWWEPANGQYQFLLTSAIRLVHSWVHFAASFLEHRGGSCSLSLLERGPRLIARSYTGRGFNLIWRLQTKRPRQSLYVCWCDLALECFIQNSVCEVPRLPPKLCMSTSGATADWEDVEQQQLLVSRQADIWDMSRQQP